MQQFFTHFALMMQRQCSMNGKMISFCVIAASISLGGTSTKMNTNEIRTIEPIPATTRNIFWNRGRCKPWRI